MGTLGRWIKHWIWSASIAAAVAAHALMLAYADVFPATIGGGLLGLGLVESPFVAVLAFVGFELRHDHIARARRSREAKSSHSVFGQGED